MALDWVNVKEAPYSAVGDGVANDTTALQSAINSGKKVYIPSGQYLINDVLAGSAHLHIEGDGHQVSIIIQSNTAKNGITFTDCNDVVLKNFRLQGPNSGTGVGIALLRSVSGVVFRHIYEGLYIREFGSHGIEGDQVAQTILTNVTCESNLGHGFNFHGTVASTAGTSIMFNTCYANNNDLAGFRLYKMVYSTLNSCAADHAGIGYLIDTCQSVSLNGCGSEYPQNNSGSYPGTSFKIDGGSRGITLISPWINHNLEKGVYVTGSSTGVTLLDVHENEPEEDATAVVQVDAGCRVTMNEAGSTDGSFAPKPLVLAAGTTSRLDALSVVEGTNAKMGIATLLQGTVTVQTTQVTADSRIFLTCQAQTTDGPPGFLRVSTRTAGESFVIRSSSNTDRSQVAWLIVEPS